MWLLALSLLSGLSITAIALAQDAQLIHVGIQAGDESILIFSPASVNAASGAIVTFVFDSVPSNHSVVQSTFESPCQPLKGGFASGFIIVPDGSMAPFPTWNLTIEDDTQPIWFYCAQTQLLPYCEGGMVGVINPPRSNETFESFQSNAKAQTTVGAPKPALSGVNALASVAPGPLTGNFSGVDLPTGTISISDTFSQTSTATTSAIIKHTSSPSSGQNTTSSRVPVETNLRQTGRHVPAGTIAGAVIGSVCAAIVAAVGIFYVLRHQRHGRAIREGDPRQQRSWYIDGQSMRQRLNDGEATVGQPAEPDTMNMRYYDPDDPSTYPPPIPVIHRERAVPPQPAGVPEVYGSP
ncbi:hypothetical protein C8Q70DRAFT_934012 [Cubamyces menziesii]|uniref:Extracellular serine-rich protein n=1 Tax=Trametes cubensis TaxID=1111947 RepID=A0AAD7XCI4_9APHY|nr:hypothetical protein C8Q70DRAFT_934012 [Cubamyces menziesii]KAJ8475362.1 hypothetical protein ONZ51_g6598 [Trametes cubensis]